MRIVRVDKPWGHELIWARTNKYTAKILVVKAGEYLSLQYHKSKDEVMLLRKGKAVLLLREEEIEMSLEESYHIEPGVVHRVKALEDSEILEVSTPSDGSDVVRLQDEYGRADKVEAKQ